MGLQGRIFIARHVETVFNAKRIMQGTKILHTPITRRGFAQADAMGKALGNYLGTRQSLALWSAATGRANQTLAIMCEHIGQDWHEARSDARLDEIDVGTWTGRSYASIVAEQGEILDSSVSLFNTRPTEGEYYDDVAVRLQNWIDETKDERGDRLVIMHGMSSRVLRGLLLGLDVDPRWKAPIANSIPQGSIAMIGNGQEKIVHQGVS